MTSEREQMSYLTQKEYEISGNSLRAFYDAAGELIFVVDSTINDRKPNVLLVMNPVENRKWDDILSNDYGVDLENVRPKKDNKYQKLDIEYDGLDIYERLINDYENGENLDFDLSALAAIRDISVRRSAAERLENSESNAIKTRETILKTNETIAELQVKLKQLRAKLSQQKKQVGKEPTKQSAAKILRTEAQIDATNEKLSRAKKRLLNAQKRLVAADEDAEIARRILSREPVDTSVIKKSRESSVSLPARQSNKDLVVKQEAPVPVMQDTDFYEEIENNFVEQQKAEQMADEEVKPLFDKDPEILDEEIAFKPIDFGNIDSEPVVQQSTPKIENDFKEIAVHDNNSADETLTFVPPVSRRTVQENNPINVRPVDAAEEKQPAPVLNTITSVEMPQVNISNETFSQTERAESLQSPAPVMPEQPSNINLNQNLNGGEKNISPAPVASEFRPVSPITGGAIPTTPAPKKPTLLYYVMLVLLIALSIFTLWLYQKNISSDNTPDLTAPLQQVEENAKTEEVLENVNTSAESAFIPELPVEEEVNVESVQIEVPAPEKAEPVQIETEIEPEPVPVTAPVQQDTVVVEPEPVVVEVEDEGPFIQPINQPEPIAEPEPVIPTEEEIIASKPAYNVSQNEKMFVAAPEYETDMPYYEEEEYGSDEMPLCPDGAEPDMNGCCAGEIYTDMGDAGFNCCPETGGDCFPPLF